MLNVLISLLAARGVLTDEEAEHLAKKLSSVIHPQDFKDAQRIVDKVLKELHEESKSVMDDIDDSLHLSS